MSEVVRGTKRDLTRPAEVLLVEDNDDDVFITRRGFERAGVPVNLHRVEDGRCCMEFLRKEGAYTEAPTPDLILLDLNLPVMDGREVLAAIVESESLRKIPVVVLTTSDMDQDILDMYDLRCSSYVAKPVEFAEFQQLIATLSHYWFTIVILPTAAA